jgi:hypothetical protein
MNRYVSIALAFSSLFMSIHMKAMMKISYINLPITTGFLNTLCPQDVGKFANFLLKLQKDLDQANSAQQEICSLFYKIYPAKTLLLNKALASLCYYLMNNKDILQNTVFVAWLRNIKKDDRDLQKYLDCLFSDAFLWQIRSDSSENKEDRLHSPLHQTTLIPSLNLIKNDESKEKIKNLHKRLMKKDLENYKNTIARFTQLESGLQLNTWQHHSIMCDILYKSETERLHCQHRFLEEVLIRESAYLKKIKETNPVRFDIGKDIIEWIIAPLTEKGRINRLLTIIAPEKTASEIKEFLDPGYYGITCWKNPKIVGFTYLNKTEHFNFLENLAPFQEEKIKPFLQELTFNLGDPSHFYVYNIICELRYDNYSYQKEAAYTLMLEERIKNIVWHTHHAAHCKDNDRYLFLGQSPKAYRMYFEQNAEFSRNIRRA